MGKNGGEIMYQRKLEKDIRCPLEYGMELFGGKWNSRIICVLAALGTLRYSELRREMGSITDAVLASTLKGLIANGIVERRSYDEIPPRVEYSLTEKGRSVVPILQSICQWAGVFYKDAGETPMISVGSATIEGDLMNECDQLLAAAPVPMASFKLAIPAVAAQLINILYNLVDKMFIGHIPEVGKQALAGVGVTALVILAISAFAALVSMGGAPKAIFLTIWRRIVLLIPLIFLLPRVWPDAVTGVYMAEPIADTIAVCTTAPMFYAYYRKLK